jgi:hypothetical protein
LAYLKPPTSCFDKQTYNLAASMKPVAGQTVDDSPNSDMVPVRRNPSFADDRMLTGMLSPLELDCFVISQYVAQHE